MVEEGATHLATLTSRASFRMSTEVRVSWVQEGEVGEVDGKEAAVLDLTRVRKEDGEGQVGCLIIVQGTVCRREGRGEEVDSSSPADQTAAHWQAREGSALLLHLHLSLRCRCRCWGAGCGHCTVEEVQGGGGGRGGGAAPWPPGHEQ